MKNTVAVRATVAILALIALTIIIFSVLPKTAASDTPVIIEIPPTPETLPVPPELPPKQMILTAFGEKADLMLQIATAESSMETKAYNPEWHYDRNGNKLCQGSFGLFQIGCVNYDGDPTDLYDPAVNIRVAQEILVSQGYRAWSVCGTKVDCG